MAQRSVWVWGLVASMGTAAVGVSVNVATDWVTSAAAWIVVAVLAVLAGLATVRFTIVSAQSATPPLTDAQRPPARRGEAPPPNGTVNTFTGHAHGPVIQAGTIHGGVHDHSASEARRDHPGREGETRS